MSLDQYGGFLDAPCSGGSTGLFYTEKAPSGRWRFCSPEGHAFFMGSAYAIGLLNSGWLPKYANSVETWRQDTVLRMKAWNFNTLGIYWTTEMPPIKWGTTGTGNPQKMPFVHIFRMVDRASRNRDAVGTGPIKLINNGTCTNPPPPHASCNHALNPFGAYWDVYDAAFTTYATNMAKTTFQTQGSYPADFPDSWATGKQWCLGFVPDDSDNLTGLSGPGPEYPGRDGTIHPHPGHVVATAPPVQNNNTYLNGLGCVPVGSCDPYTDKTVYSKNAWRDYLIVKYSTIGALNTAWGSNYTTFNVDLGYPAATTGSHGLLDEDGSHAWIGTDVFAQSGANANAKADMNTFLQDYAAKYYNIVGTAIRAANPGMLVFSSAPVNSHAGMVRREVLRGAGPYLDVIDTEFDPTRPVIAQQTYLEAGKPLVNSIYTSSPADSDATNMGANPYQIYVTQTARGQGWLDALAGQMGIQAIDGSFPYLGITQWAFSDVSSGAGTVNWGLTSGKDNSYDGGEDVVASVPCSVPLETLACGGELSNHGNFTGAVRIALLEARKLILNS